MADVLLRAGRDRSVRRRHPWILSGAVERVEGEAAPGDAVRVVSAEGELLGFGCLSPRSSLRVRIHSFGKDDPDEGWLESGIETAVRRRRGDPLLAHTDAVRLVNAEGDGLPGLVVDRYGETAVVRASAAGIWARRDRVAAALRDATGLAAGIERADATAARREGAAVSEGALWGSPPEGTVEIREGTRRYAVDPWHGQKTGFYLDQRDARRLVETLAFGREVLDVFSYTGGFAVAAAAGGAAEITAVESSREALALAEHNLGLHGAEADLVCADAFEYLRSATGFHDLIVLDPPPLARRRADVPAATRAAKDLMLSAFRRLAPEGLLLVFACSHHLGPDLFRKVAFGASLDAGRPVQVLRELQAPSDHPVSLDHPEGRYLSGLLLRCTG